MIADNTPIILEMSAGCFEGLDGAITVVMMGSGMDDLEEAPIRVGIVCECCVGEPCGTPVGTLVQQRNILTNNRLGRSVRRCATVDGCHGTRNGFLPGNVAMAGHARSLVATGRLFGQSSASRRHFIPSIRAWVGDGFSAPLSRVSVSATTCVRPPAASGGGLVSPPISL